MRLVLAILSVGAVVALTSCQPTPLPEGAEPVSVETTCARAIAEDRMDGYDQSQCTCFLTKARETLDPDIAQRLFVALYTGQSQMPSLDQLPEARRASVAGQFQQLSEAMPSCGINAPAPTR